MKERGDVLRALGPGARHALTVHLLLMHDYALIDGECVDRWVGFVDSLLRLAMGYDSMDFSSKGCISV